MEFNSEAKEEDYKNLLDADTSHIDMQIWYVSQVSKGHFVKKGEYLSVSLLRSGVWRLRRSLHHMSGLLVL